MNLKKRYVLALLLILVVVSSCSLSGKKGTSSSKSSKRAAEEIRTGTQGILVSFLQNAPPDKIVVEQSADIKVNGFEVILDVRNKGAYPQPENGIPAPVGAKVFLTGYDRNVIFFEKNPPSEDLSNKPLDGKSTINPNGGQDLITFKGYVNIENLNVEKYEPILQATACYQYWTIAGPSVCIDPDPYSTVSGRKVCEAQDVTLASQGAPVAVTKIEEEAFASKTQFRITVKNVGGGDVFKDKALEKCGPEGEKIVREDIDKIYIAYVKIGNKDLLCGPFIDRPNTEVREKAGYIRMINGEGHVICELQSADYSSTKAAYTTPINILLQYGYRNVVEKKLLIKKETSGLGSSSSSSASSSASSTQTTQSGSDSEGKPFFT